MKFFLFTLMVSCATVWAADVNGLERWAVEPQANTFENLVGTYIPNLQITSTSEHKSKIYSKNHPLTVITILDVDCPIAKKLSPKLPRLEKEFHQLAFKYIVINPTTGVENAKEVFSERNLSGELLFDSNRTFRNTLRIKTTCETFVIDQQGTLQYRGAIDDQYGINITKAEPKHQYLKDAIANLLDGKEVEYPLTGAPGCLVALDEEKSSPNETLSFHKDVSRILQRKCQVCHHTGGVGPFELISFEEVKERRRMIRYVLKKDLMPPWFADDNRAWRHDFSLEEGEKNTLLGWIEAGAPEGHKEDAPAPKVWSNEGIFKKPDLVLTFPKMKVQAEGFMDYVYATVAVPITEDKWVRAVETRTQQPQVLHHALVFTTDDPNQKRVNAIAGFFAGYVPGAPVNDFPPGTGKLLRKGSYLIAQIHFTPNGKAVEDQISLHFDFYDAPPQREVVTKSAFNRKFEIPPRAENHRVTGRHKFLEDGFIAGLNPHAHLRGKSFKYELALPDGTRETLINIPNYDFNWQINYQPLDPVFTPAGSTIEVIAHFDNSANNKNNPDPSATVTFGEQTNDEMMIGYFEWYSSTLLKDRQPDHLLASLPKEVRAFVEEIQKQLKDKTMGPREARKAVSNFLKKGMRKGQYRRADVDQYVSAIQRHFKENLQGG